MAKDTSDIEPTSRRSYWQRELELSHKRYATFHSDGDKTIDEYRLESGNSSNADKYNILYSSTETIRPNLYAQTPIPRVELNFKDTATQDQRDAALLLQNNLKYTLSTQSFDNVMDGVVEDILLPGLSTAWVLYIPIISTDSENNEMLADEKVEYEYVYWKDIRTGNARNWATMPWVAKAVYFTKKDAIARWGAEKASQLTYTDKNNDRDDNVGDSKALIWEIWDKINGEVLWYSDCYKHDILEVVPDPLKLKHFFPCPEPLRAIKNNRTFIPRSLYSQYRSQARTLNELTRRIRLLTEAIRVAGVYDGSQEALANLLSPTAGNKMVKVDGWASFAQQGGLKGSVEWVPLEAVVSALMQLLQAREVCKNEIYEITGFSDIVRGASKASETLGAQRIKENWAGARVKKVQKDVQRFARDLLSIAGEIIAEHYSIKSLALYGGFNIPSAQDVTANPDVASKWERFQRAVKVLRSDAKRCAAVDIETDSTIMADEAAERQDRMQFLTSASSFLQQAVPTMERAPQLAPLLSALLMFGVRTFPASRPIEEVFEQVQQGMQQNPPTPPQQNNDKQDAAATAQIAANAQKEIESAKQAAAANEANLKRDIEMQKLEQARIEEDNRHFEKMRELDLREREVAVREQELALKENVELAKLDEEATQNEHNRMMAENDAEETAINSEHSRNMAERSAEQDTDNE